MLAATAAVSVRAAPLSAGVRRVPAAAALNRRPARQFAISRLTADGRQPTRTQAVGSTTVQLPSAADAHSPYPTAGVADQLQSMPQAFAWAAQQWGDAPAIEDRHRQPHTKLTFRQLHEQITCFAAGLSTLGVRPGDRRVCSTGERGWGLWGGSVCWCLLAFCTAVRVAVCDQAGAFSTLVHPQGGTVQREQRPLGGSRPGKLIVVVAPSKWLPLRLHPKLLMPGCACCYPPPPPVCRASKLQAGLIVFEAPYPSPQALSFTCLRCIAAPSVAHFSLVACLLANVAIAEVDLGACCPAHPQRSWPTSWRPRRPQRWWCRMLPPWSA